MLCARCNKNAFILLSFGEKTDDDDDDDDDGFFLCFSAATNICNANRTTSKSKTTRNEPGITRTS